ncbi:MAG: hypothetical protein OXG41_00725 [Acidimicrobiaceae bacterium]|nr:hypothetical protein [Acidimicrobiaceae bacterium]
MPDVDTASGLSESTGQCRRIAVPVDVVPIDELGTETKEGVLEAAIFDLVSPDGGLADLMRASRCFVEQDVASLKLVLREVHIVEVHHLDVVETDALPGDVCCAEIRPHLLACVMLR